MNLPSVKLFKPANMTNSTANWKSFIVVSFWCIPLGSSDVLVFLASGCD